jgi:hypothetical protein
MDASSGQKNREPKITHWAMGETTHAKSYNKNKPWPSGKSYPKVLQ